MNLGDLRTFSRIAVPGAKKVRVTDPQLDLIINEVCIDMNYRMGILRTDAKFDRTADKYKYDLSKASETVSRFGKIDKMGLWWNAGSASQVNWRRIYPKTMKWLDTNFENWRDQTSTTPRYYAKQARFLVLYPTPDTALTDGLWLYFIENLVRMSEDSHFPWGHTIEFTEYAFLSKVIIKGVEAWLKQPAGKDRESSSAYGEYRIMVEEAKGLLEHSPDLQSDKKARIHLRRVC